MEETMDINLKEIFKALLKGAWIILLCAVLLGSAMLAYTVKFVTPMYTASVTLYVSNGSSGTSNGNGVSSGGLAVALQLVNTYVNMIQTESVLNKVIEENNFNLTAGQIRSMMSASSVGETEIFKVSITSPDPVLSRDVANAIADVAPDEIAPVIGNRAQVVDPAQLPTSRSSPSYTANAIVGAMTGAFLAAAVIVLYACLDKRIKSEDDLMKICNMPVLGAIPDFTQIAKTTEKKVGVKGR